MNRSLLTSILYSCIGLVIFAVLIPLATKAYDVGFYSSNDILFYDPEDKGMKDSDSNPTYDADKAKLAKIIIDSKKVYDDSRQLQEIADGKRTNVDRGILLVLIELINKGYSFAVSSLHREYDPDFPFNTSKHLIGRAVDIYIINNKQLVYGSPDSSEVTRLTQRFISDAAPILLKYANGPCWIGQPDPDGKYNAGPCDTKWDGGNGPHVHLDLRDGTDTTISYDSSAAIKKTDVTYSVVKTGSTVDVASFESFRKTAKETLNSPLGWAQLGITFSEIPSGGMFTLYLSDSKLMQKFNYDETKTSPCDTTFSCSIDNKVVINYDRWTQGSPIKDWPSSFSSVGTTSSSALVGTIANYQTMLINHEVGHWLGNPDIWEYKKFDLSIPYCPKNGSVAPIMLQQSMSLRECSPNPWPLESELKAPDLGYY